MFDYPPKVEESATKKTEELTTAVLSTTAKAQQRAKRAEKEKAAKEAAVAKGDGEAMDVEPTTSTPATPGPSAEEKMDVDEETKEGEGDKKEVEGEKKEGEGDKKKRIEKEKVGYELTNLSRVLPEQLRYIAFLEDGRYEPVKKVCHTLHIP